MGKGGTAKPAQQDELVCLLASEHRRFKRRLFPGMSAETAPVQLVVLRPAFSSAAARENALPDACAGIKSLVQECDSVIALDRETLALFLPRASLQLARSFLKKALASLAPQTAQGLLVTITESAFDDFSPAEIGDRIRAELQKDCKAGQTGQQKRKQARHIVLGGDRPCDQARVSAEERSFLLSPLSS